MEPLDHCERCRRNAEEITRGAWSWRIWVKATGAPICPWCLTQLEERAIFGPYLERIEHPLDDLEE